jgi:hypothetical protein
MPNQYDEIPRQPVTLIRSALLLCKVTLPVALEY